jgi:hypothetical protein
MSGESVGLVFADLEFLCHDTLIVELEKVLSILWDLMV